jgi:hypothetical protein
VGPLGRGGRQGQGGVVHGRSPFVESVSACVEARKQFFIQLQSGPSALRNAAVPPYSPWPQHSTRVSSKAAAMCFELP